MNRIVASIVAVALAFGDRAVAQTGTVGGRVTSLQTRQPIEGVAVVIVGTSYAIKTKADGQFQILGVPPGTYTVKAQLPGYARGNAEGVVVRVDAFRQLDFELSFDPQSPDRPPQTEPAIAPQQALTSGDDPFTRCLFPPEAVMRAQRTIGVDDAQRAKLIAEMSSAQAKFTQTQWTMTAEAQRLEALLKPGSVDETAAVKQLDRMLAVEQELKRAQMTLLIRVKNTLTPRQQEMLRLELTPDGRPRARDGSVLPPCGS